MPAKWKKFLKENPMMTNTRKRELNIPRREGGSVSRVEEVLEQVRKDIKKYGCVQFTTIDKARALGLPGKICKDPLALELEKKLREADIGENEITSSEIDHLTIGFRQLKERRNPDLILNKENLSEIIMGSRTFHGSANQKRIRNALRKLIETM